MTKKKQTDPRSPEDRWISSIREMVLTTRQSNDRRLEIVKEAADIGEKIQAQVQVTDDLYRMLTKADVDSQDFKDVAIAASKNQRELSRLQNQFEKLKVEDHLLVMTIDTLKRLILGSPCPYGDGDVPPWISLPSSTDL